MRSVGQHWIWHESGVPCHWVSGQNPGTQNESTPMNIKNVAVALVTLIASSAAQAQDEPMQWRVQDGGNGHWYQRVSLTNEVTWSDASQAAMAGSGHLVTLTSAAEQAWVQANFITGHPTCSPASWATPRAIWIGLYQDTTSPSYSEPSGGWRWVTDEPFAYSNWSASEPNNVDTPANFAGAYGNGSWDDTRNDAGIYCHRGYVIEWSADCNNDGIVDYGQILDGTFPDANNNGVPDCCDQGVPCSSTLLVPQQYPTIQAAVDAAGATGLYTVQVAAGTFPGPVHVNGKNVLIRGAGANLTIVSGTGTAQASVVRFSDAPVGSGLEALTVSDGIGGSLFPTNPTVLIGGGLFVYRGSISVRDCVIEDNRAGFGGGAYIWKATGSIEDCVFRNNEASTDGGGFQLYGGTIGVDGTSVTGNYANSRGGGVHLVEGVFSVSGSSFTNNFSNNVVGGMSWVPGNPAVTSSLNLNGVTVTQNLALVGQGGIGIVGNGVSGVTQVGNSIVCQNTPLPNISGPYTNFGGNSICVCLGDVIADGLVNGVDLSAVLSAWGTDGGPKGRADANRDGLVDGFDLAIVLGGWGPCPN